MNILQKRKVLDKFFLLELIFSLQIQDFCIIVLILRFQAINFRLQVIDFCIQALILSFHALIFSFQAIDFRSQALDLSHKFLNLAFRFFLTIDTLRLIHHWLRVYSLFILLVFFNGISFLLIFLNQLFFLFFHLLNDLFFLDLFKFVQNDLLLLFLGSLF